MKTFILAMFLFLGGSATTFAQDDFQYWSRAQVKAVDTQYVDYINSWELRFLNDSSHLGYWNTSQKLQIDPMKNLGFGIGYTYLESEVDNSQKTQNEFKYQHRLELEMNPYWKWRDQFAVKNRNRVEFRWIEDKGSDNGRFRQLWEIEVPVKNIPRVQSVYISNEFFVDFKQREINENWVVPFGVTVQVYRKTALKFFYMIQSKKTTRDWTSNQVLGTHLLVAF